MVSNLAFLLSALAIMVAGWPFAADNDVYFHLACGKRIWESGGPLLRDVFTYTALGQPDESWHSWLSQAVFFKLYDAFGPRGLYALNFCLVAITIVCVVRFTQRQTKSASASLLAGTLALLIHHHVQILRPLLFGETLFALTVFLVVPWGRAMTYRRMFAGMGIAVLWANLHGSAVIVPFIYFAHALTNWRSDWLTRTSPLVILAATILNPNGIALYPYALELTRVGKMSGGWEWAGSPPLTFHQPFAELSRLRISLDVPSLVILAGLAWMLLFKGWRQAPQALPFLLLPLLSIRHGVYLLFPAALLCARFLGRVPRIAGWAISIGLLAFFRFYESYDVTPSIQKTADFIRATRVEGNVLADPAWANFLTFESFPSVRVAYDTRTLLHRDFYARARELFDRFGKEAWEILIRQPPPGTQLVLLGSDSIRAIDPTQWVVVYRNNHAALAVRREEHETLARVTDYYHQNEVPFSITKGFSLEEASRQSPRWLEKQWESNEWGRWPEAEAVNRWRRNQKKFYEEQIQLDKNLG